MRYTIEVEQPAIDNFVRASGETACALCGFPYWKHPRVKNHEWLVAVCDGRTVKL